jgi:hypothetical protein
MSESNDHQQSIGSSGALDLTFALRMLGLQGSERQMRSTSAALLLSLEADAACARGGFACMFSNSDEYETALITQRRAQGCYGRSYNPWPMLAFAGCASLIAALAAFFH